jgi:hypothetical protein
MAMSKSNAVPIALAGLFLLASGAPAAAQSLSDLAVSDLGALVGPNHLHVSLTGAAAYETNVLHSAPAQAAGRGLKAEDEIYTPSATLDFQQNVGRGTAALTGTAGYNFYSHDKALNRENLSLQGILQQQVSLCQGDLKVSLSRALNQLVDVTVQQIDETYTQASVGGDVSCGRPVGFAPTVSVSESWGNNSDQALSISNSQTFNSSAGLAYRTAAQGTLSVSGIYRDTEFPSNIPTLNTGKSGYQTTGATIRYERQLGARIQGSASATYTIVQGGLVADFKGLTYTADITYRAGSRLHFEGDFSRQVIPSNLANASYRVESDESVAGHYNLSSRLLFSLGASQQVGDEAGSFSQVSLLHYDEKTIFSSLTLSLRKVSLSLNVRNDHRTTNQAGLNYSDTRASISASTQF